MVLYVPSRTQLFYLQKFRVLVRLSCAYPELLYVKKLCSVSPVPETSVSEKVVFCRARTRTTIAGVLPVTGTSYRTHKSSG